MVAHPGDPIRLVFVQACDQIVVLEEGELRERGTHEELLANKGAYRSLYDLQLRSQEEFQSFYE